MRFLILFLVTSFYVAALSSCKLSDQNASLASDDLSGQAALDKKPPFTFQQVKSEENEKLKIYRQGLVQESNPAFRFYYRDMFESTWFAEDGYSVHLSLENVQAVAVREASRRFSAYDRSELRRGLSQELRALKIAKSELPAQAKKKQEELERYVASYQNSRSLGTIADRLHPHIDTSSEEYWQVREFKAKSSAKYARLQKEISAVTSELAAINRREQVLAGVVSRLGKN